MKAYCLQHVPFETPAAIATWLSESQFETEYINLFETFTIPALSEIDWLIVMGGPMSVNDENIFPWLAEEKKLIRNCIDSGKKVVGVCLGSQLIANALDCRVYQGKQKEIGWFPIRRIAHDTPSIFSMPEEITVFHWHGETFDLPQGARLIASSEACTNQIFSYGNNVLAMQCHLEMTTAAINGMLIHCANEIQPASFIQLPDEIEKGTLKYATAANNLLFSLLNELKNN